VSRSFDVADADWVTVGTVGEPGRRTFYLQLAVADSVLALKLEKTQVAQMSELLTEILSDLPGPPTPLPDPPELQEPVDAEWAVGAAQLAYDSDADRIVLLAEEAAPEDTPDRGTARLSITREQALGLARRGFDLVEAGRPPCPLCGHPLDPEGHSCPRTNGHRPPTP
jgi:uncharacterized repeat protein (TIGR03847 family)